MEKKGSGFSSGWQARRFVCAGHYLMYSDDTVSAKSLAKDMQRERNVKGAIDLDHLAEVKLLHTKKYTIIEMVTDGVNHDAGIIKLRVKTNEEAHEWIDAFNSCMSEAMDLHEEEDQDETDDADAEDESPPSATKFLT